jgi:hypothetical protein
MASEELREAVRDDKALASRAEQLAELLSGVSPEEFQIAAESGDWDEVRRLVGASEEELLDLFAFFQRSANALAERFPELREFGPPD